LNGYEERMHGRSPPPPSPMKGKKNMRKIMLNNMPLAWHNVEKEPLIRGQLQKWCIISMGLIIQKNKGKTFKDFFFLRK